MSITLPDDIYVHFIEQGIKTGLIQNVLRTLDGEYYMNSHFLQSELSLVIDKQGKSTLEELSERMNIEQSDITHAIEIISPNKNWIIMEDIVMTPKYLGERIQEMKHHLQQTKCTSIVSQRDRVKLPYSIVKHIISAIDKADYVIYPEAPDIISTKDFIGESRDIIKEKLNGLDEPTPMYKLQKALNIQEDVFYILLEQIMKSGHDIIGTIRGKRTRAVYEPLCYKQRQITLIKSIFDSNEMINLKTIENLYPFMNPIDIIKEEYLDQSFYCLPTHIVKSSLISKAKSILIGIQEHHNMNDVAPSLPPEDINKVIEISIAELKADKSSLFQHQKYIVMEDGFIVKTDYIQLMVDHSKDFLSNLVIRLKQKHKAINKTSLTEREVITAFESVGCSPSIAKTIAPFAMKSMNKEYEDIMKTPYVPELHITVDKWISQYKLKEYQSLVDLRHSIYFNYMSACSFKDKTAKKKLEKYILKDQGNDFLFHLVIYSVLNQSYSQSDIEQSTLDILPADIENSVTMDAKDRKRVIDTFVQSNDHRYDKSDIIQFSQLLQEKKLKELIDEFIVQTKGQLFTKETSLLLDSSKSKFSRLIREQLLNQLKELSLEAMYAPQLLHIVCLILFQSLYKMPLYVSGKCVPIVLMEIKPLLEKKDQELLEFIHDSIIHQDTTEHNTEYERLRTLGIQYAEDWA